MEKIGLARLSDLGVPDRLVVQMRKIDRIDTRGNIREHWTLDDRATLCGLSIGLRQKPCENSPCLRCQKIVLAASRKKNP
jgi:hypothetical protein